MPISIESSCKFCNSANLLEFRARERMLAMGDEFTYQQCEDCGALQLKDVPQDLAKYYPRRYYSFEELVKSSPLRLFLKKLRMKALIAGIPIPEPPYAYWLKKLKPKLNDRIADVGCGNGQLLYELYAGGFRYLHGFDLFIEGDEKIAPGLQLWKKEIGEALETFDLIMMHHAFEHMGDPEEVLRSCYKRLRPGGKLLIRTPVSDATVFKEDKAFWVQLDAPRHLVIPSVRGFEQLAKRIGFEWNAVEFDSDAFQFKGTELYKLGKPLDARLLQTSFSAEQEAIFHKKALQLNREGKGDQACFFLSKPKS